MWDALGGNELLTLRGHTGFVFDVAFSPYGKSLATSGMEGTVKVWNVENAQELPTLRGHRGNVTRIAFRGC